MMKTFFIVCIFLFSIEIFASIPKKSFHIQDTLKKDFVSLVSKAKEFHKIIKDGGDKISFKKERLATEDIINKLYPQVLSMPHLHQRLHSYKLLQAIEENLAILQSQGMHNKKVIKKLFKFFFEITQVYDLKPSVVGHIFYCSKDKSTWFQSGPKPINPINPQFKNCGNRL